MTPPYGLERSATRVIVGRRHGSEEPSAEKNQKGLEKIRDLLVDTPVESLKDISKPPKSQIRSRS